ncbi:butyrophilin subfamily 3 member A3-like [Chroicocephalus ridibundus]|uniref:butyrophilin subfamily 3 member A3-like n=1 Tax=Chroicocephalus ridibundus TaxID=1192867 RepID=UPI002FDD66EB
MQENGGLLLTRVLLLALHIAGKLQVTPHLDIMGVVGQDVTLPCHITSTEPLDIIEVQWVKIIDWKTESVHKYTKLAGDEPGEKYQGRTTLLRDGFTIGNMSLLLKSVQPADNGKYSCIVISNRGARDITTTLSIAGSGAVSIDVLGDQGQGVELVCRSQGWFPKPIVQWVTKNMQHLSPDTAVHQDKEQFFSVLSRVVVSGEEMGEIGCQIQNNLMQKGEDFSITLSETEKRLLLAEENDLKVRCGKRPFTVENGKGAAIVEKRQNCTAPGNAEMSLMLEPGVNALSRALVPAKQSPGVTVCPIPTGNLVPITLDEAQKHSELAVSSDRRIVQHKPSAQQPVMGRQLPIVVGREGFASGRCYWEVHVGDGLDWELGVLTEPVRGTLKERSWKDLPEDGVWLLRRVNGKYWPEDVNAKILSSQKVQLRVVGLDLNLELSTLSFYNIVTDDCILDISIKGIEGSTKLYPFLRPGLGEAGEKGKPLTINHNTDWDFPSTV